MMITWSSPSTSETFDSHLDSHRGESQEHAMDAVEQEVRTYATLWTPTFAMDTAWEDSGSASWGSNPCSPAT